MPTSWRCRLRLFFLAHARKEAIWPDANGPQVPVYDAHYHRNLETPGSFNVAGGYFLDGNLESLDPTFFNVTPVEAQWLVPQQRRMLEVSYECLESAGVTLEAIAGSNTAVFVGSLTSDYRNFDIRLTMIIIF